MNHAPTGRESSGSDPALSMSVFYSAFFIFSLPFCAPVSHSSSGVMSRRCAVSREGGELPQQLEGAAHPSALLEHAANRLLAT